MQMRSSDGNLMYVLFTFNLRAESFTLPQHIGVYNASLNFIKKKSFYIELVQLPMKQVFINIQSTKKNLSEAIPMSLKCQSE